MLTWIKRLFWLLLIITGIAFLHYNLPQRDIVQITGTDVKRMDIRSGAFGWGGADAGTEKFDQRDVRFINTSKKNGDPMVYRNEDTDWSWPPYFKFDTGNITAQAQALAKQDDQWVAVRHYGWRIPIWSIYPNAVSIKKVDGPDVVLIPWFNIVFLTILALIIMRLFVTVSRFKIKHIDPVSDKIEDAIGDAQDEAQRTKQAAGNFFTRIFGSSKK